MKAQGYLDKLLRGYRVYIIRADAKDKDGNNIVLHESWHQSLDAANKAYVAAIADLIMTVEYSNCPAVPETNMGKEYWNEVFGIEVV